MNPEILERDIYNELPEPVAEFSGRLESLAAELLEEKEKSPEAASLTLPFHDQDPTKRTYAVGAPVLITQNPEYHQFDALTHLDIAAYHAQEYKVYLLPLLTAHNAKMVQTVLENEDITSFAVAAQLHDIEKVFWVSTVNKEHPWEKSPTRVKLNLLNLDEPAESAKPKIQRHFLLGDNGFSTGEPTFDSLAGYFKNAGVDAERALAILEVYGAIDRSFIENGDAKINDETFTRDFLRASEGKELPVVLLGILTMMCDNLAQGDPPEKDDQFEVEFKEHIRRCQLLIDAVLSEHD